MIDWRRFAALVVGLLAAPALLSQGIEVRVNRTEVTIEDIIQMSVTIEGSQSAEPVLPPLDDFTVRYMGPSSEIQVVNGRVTRRITHSYALSPLRVGLLTVASASVDIDGRSYSSRAFQIRVLPADARPQEEKNAFVAVSLSTREPWVGEQILYVWRFYRVPGSAGNAQLLSQEFGDLLVENLGDVREFRTTRGGREYEVSEIRRALFAQRAGAITIPSSEMRADLVVEEQLRQGRRRGLFDDFFSAVATESRVLRTRPIELVVKELPPAPPGFSGLVGKFEISSEVSRRTLNLGDSITQKVVISGTGSVLMIPEPLWQVEEDDFKVYVEPASFSLDRQSEGLGARKSFERALVPQRSGELVVPPVRLSFFDPEAALFSEVSTDAVLLQVAEAASDEDVGLVSGGATAKAAVAVLDDGILPIHRGSDAIAVYRWATSLRSALLWGPPILFIAFSIRRNWQVRMDPKDPGLRQRRALRNAVRQVRAAEVLDPQGETVKAPDRILAEYLGDRLQCPSGAMTPAECRSLLESHSVEPALVERSTVLIAQAHAARYSGSRPGGVTSPEDLEELLREIDRSLERSE